MPPTDLTQTYWEKKILRWERMRYSTLARFHPFAWSVRRRLLGAANLVRAQIPQGSSVLELGCGSGYFARLIESHVSRYLGIDVATNAISLAQKLNSIPNFGFIAGDIRKMTFPQSDLVVFLGLSDWLNPEEFQQVLLDIQSEFVLFSFTQIQPRSPYRMYRRLTDGASQEQEIFGRGYLRSTVESFLGQANFEMTKLVPPSFLNPGALVWARAKQ
jgi:SAM-dependent methyltransferase